MMGLEKNDPSRKTGLFVAFQANIAAAEVQKLGGSQGWFRCCWFVGLFFFPLEMSIFV